MLPSWLEFVVMGHGAVGVVEGVCERAFDGRIVRRTLVWLDSIARLLISLVAWVCF
jgi:hypothetical protein